MTLLTLLIVPTIVAAVLILAAAVRNQIRPEW